MVASNDQVESLQRVGSGNPVLRRRGIGPAVDQVPQTEDAVVLAHLQLCEPSAQGREVPVHVPDNEVSAPVVSFEMRGEVRAGRGKGEGLLHQLTTSWPVMDERRCSSRSA